MADTIRVTVLELQEVDCPLVLDMDDFDVDHGEWPPCWLPPSEFPYTDEQKVTLTDQHYRNAYMLRSTSAWDLMESLYGTAALNLGTPISFDPERGKMLCAKFPKYRDVDVHKMVQDFLNLDLSHEPTTNDRDRALIIDFVQWYSPFVPFDSFAGGHLMTVDDMMDRWAQPDMERQYVITKVKGDEWKSQSVFAPYRNLVEDETKSRIFHGRFLMFFEAFALWHEAARIVHRQLESGAADKLATDLLGAMRKACTEVDQKKTRGGKVSQITLAEKAKNGADGAAALVRHFDEQLRMLNREYVGQKVRDVLKEYRNIDRKITDAERKAKGEYNPVQPRRPSYGADLDDKDVLNVLKKVDAAFDMGLNIPGLSKRKIQQVRNAIREKADTDVRLSGVEQEADARLTDRDEWEHEVKRLTEIREEVGYTLQVMRERYPQECVILELRFIEEVPYGFSEHMSEQLKKRSVYLGETAYKDAHAKAIERFSDLCNLAALDTKEKARGAAGMTRTASKTRT